jgi:hypothetical protein
MRRKFSRLAACGLLNAIVACGASNRDAERGSGGAVSTGGDAGNQNGGLHAGGMAGLGAAPTSGGEISAGGSTATGGPGAAGRTGGAAGSAAPPDPRPPAPPWVPPFAVGEPGWKRSRDPLCPTRRGQLTSFGVWADDRGVFALVADGCLYVGRDLPTCPEENAAAAGTSLQFNAGDGWRVLLDTPNQLGGLTGFANGKLLFSGYPDCALSNVAAGGGVECSLPRTEYTTGATAFVVDSSLAYVVGGNNGASPGREVFALESGVPRSLGTIPEDAGALWGDRERVLVAGANQAVYVNSANDGGFERFTGVPAGNYNAVWGDSDGNFWLANSAAQLIHYDGSQFEFIDLEPTEPWDNGARSLWGTKDTLYFVTPHRFGRVQNGAVETLLILAADDEGNAPTIDLLSLWGTDENNVFITGSDSAFDAYACGGPFMLWFDGSEVHRF